MLQSTIKAPKARIDIKKIPKTIIHWGKFRLLPCLEPNTQVREEENFIHFYSKNKPTQSSFPFALCVFFFLPSALPPFPFLLRRAIISHKAQAHTNANKFLLSFHALLWGLWCILLRGIPLRFGSDDDNWGRRGKAVKDVDFRRGNVCKFLAQNGR